VSPGEWGVKVTSERPAGGIYVEDIDGIDAGDEVAGNHDVRISFSLPGGGKQTVDLSPGQGAKLVLTDAEA
jgi:hypothetical protein